MKKRTRGPGKKPRRDRKHDPARLAGLEDARRRHGEKQEVVALEAGVAPRRLRDARQRTLEGDPEAIVGVVDRRLDERAEARDVAHKRALATIATEPYSDRAHWEQRYGKLLGRYLGEELKARGLPRPRRMIKKK